MVFLFDLLSYEYLVTDIESKITHTIPDTGDTTDPLEDKFSERKSQLRRRVCSMQQLFLGFVVGFPVRNLHRISVIN